MTTSKPHVPSNKNPSIAKIAGTVLVFSGMFLLGIITLVWFLLKTPQESLDSLNVDYMNPTINVVMEPTHTQTAGKEKESNETVLSTETNKTVNITPPDLFENQNPLKKETEPVVENFSKLLEGYSDDTLLKNISPKSWPDTNWLMPDRFDWQDDISEELNFRLIDQTDIDADLLSGLPEKISIPLININATVENLGITVKDGKQVYETPKNLVGRIPHSPEESDSFKGWYFGHLESPIKGEGNVFHDLPKIAEHLLNGDTVLISLEKSEKKLVYQATKSEIVHESDLILYDAGNKNIILVTCSNRPLYDYRQLVTATLVGLVE
tara:strand:- start:8005 stop:8976 length:972 start_codon:yes stop_codon:yes gene_type:complete